MAEKSAVTLDTIVALAKRRGFVFPTSSIYGGLANSYDYGPLGVELLRSIKNLWWREFITKRPDMVGLDSQIMLHPNTWVASGHVGAFNDPLVEDRITHKRYRADHLIEGWIEQTIKKNKEVIKEYFELNSSNTFIISSLFDPLDKTSYLNLSYEEKEKVNYLSFFAEKYKKEIHSTNIDSHTTIKEKVINLLVYCLRYIIANLRQDLVKKHSLNITPYESDYKKLSIDDVERTYKEIVKDISTLIRDKDEDKDLIIILSIVNIFRLESIDVPSMDLTKMSAFITENKILSPESNELTEAKAFNLLFESAIGAVSGEKSKVYLRGETAQGIFTDFKHILDSSRVKLPFGVGQIGKSFRNEVTTGQFVFRTFEFEQAEIEYFFDPEATDWQQLMEDWKAAMWKFATVTLGIKAERLRWRQHSDKERSHYSKDTYDLEYLFPFGWKELWGIAYRTDYDLKQHMELSGESLEVVDSATGRKFVPHVIEPAVGVNRMFLMALVDSYREDTEKERIVLELKPSLAPYQVAVFPLLKNKPELVEKARELFNSLLDQNIRVVWDDRGNIGKRYLAQDEAGTPFCITVDFQTLEDNTLTVRNRDTAEQVRIPLAELSTYLSTALN